MTFCKPGTEDGPVTNSMDFMPLGRGGQRGILALDQNGRVSIYDAACQSFSAMPTLHAPKIQPISLPVGDSVYVMDANPGGRHCFEALIHGRGPKSCCPIDWYWHSLAPPPHVRAPNYVPYDSDFSDDEDDQDFDGINMVHGPEVDAHMMAAAPIVDGHTLDDRLCAFDLTATASAMSPPLLRQLWDDIAQPEEWVPVMSYIVPLGSSKLFIAEFFETKEKVDMKGGGWVYGKRENFAVFTGVEFVEKVGGELRMVKHTSKRYNHECLLSDWVI
ncbi:unnamed protein product [Alopecurus aequalis]